MSAYATTARPARPAATDLGLLRLALGLDAVVTGVNAAAYLAGFSLLDGWLGVPASLLIGVGAFLLAFAALVGWLATRPEPARRAVTAVIAANGAWAAGSLVLLALGTFSPTLAGEIVIAVQAAGVAGLAALQVAGLRRA